MKDKHCTKKTELNEAEGIKRLKEKIKELKKQNIVPPVDDEEPTGLLSGGPEHLDFDNESNKK
ncbi:hypothetical protein [Sessilibacter sp. MAH4]